MNGIVEVVNDQVVVSSRQIADNFGKEHKDVLYAIREILTAENSAAKFFIESSYSSRGKTFPEFLMNRDGFSLLVMGFTGGKAMEWKLKYINAFNAMETELRSQHEKTQQSLARSGCLFHREHARQDVQRSAGKSGSARAFGGPKGHWYANGPISRSHSISASNGDSLTQPDRDRQTPHPNNRRSQG